MVHFWYRQALVLLCRAAGSTEIWKRCFIPEELLTVVFATRPLPRILLLAMLLYSEHIQKYRKERSISPGEAYGDVHSSCNTAAATSDTDTHPALRMAFGFAFQKFKPACGWGILSDLREIPTQERRFVNTRVFGIFCHMCVSLTTRSTGDQHAR